MRKLRALWIRFTGMLHSRRTDDEFSNELDSHIAMHVDEALRSGLSPDEARRRALIQLGGVEQVRQAQRERHTLPWLENLARDLRYATRTLSKHPAITAIAILSIGLGIGANATIFSMVSRFVLRPAPVGDPSTLLALHTTHEGDRCCNNFSLPLYADVRDEAKIFSGVAAYDELLPASISGSGEPERVWGQAVTTNFFEVLELPMVLGRGFASNEDKSPAIVLGAGLWQRHFNSDKTIIGKSINLSGRSFTVIGIAPPAFHSVDQLLGTQFWIPLGLATELAPDLAKESTSNRDFHWLAVVGRLAPGKTRLQAKAELDTLAQRFAKTYPKTDQGGGFVFEQAGSLPPREKQGVLIFLAALSVVALLVLAIAGANVANLLFAQAASRQREMAVRLALGSSRGRLRRQTLIESVILGLSGGALGVLLSLWATRGLSTFRFPAPIPLDASIALDWRVLVYTFVLSVVCGILLGMAPAWAASRPMLTNALKGEDALARPGRRVTLRNLLVVTQIAMALILLCVTGLFLRSLQSAATIDIGFNTNNLLLMSVDPRVHGYTPERTISFLNQLQQSVAALPGVQLAAVTDTTPLSGGGRADGFRREDRPDSDYITADIFMATPGYFEAMGISRVSGSDFGSETSTGPKVAVVNQLFVQRILGGQSPIGKHVSGGGSTFEIIGVVGNVKARTLGEENRPVLYRSLKQSVAGDPALMGYTIVVKTLGQPQALSAAVRRQILALDPAMAIFNEETMDEHIRGAFFLPRLAATLFGSFGFIGIVLATVGLYGVMSYAVSRRRREIGIRMALGAQAGKVERLILRQSLTLTLIAVLIGWPAAWMLARMASSFLYGIQPHDALTFSLVPPFLVVVALLACWLPARRAASIDPVQALRTE